MKYFVGGCTLLIRYMASISETRKAVEAALAAKRNAIPKVRATTDVTLAASSDEVEETQFDFEPEVR